MFVLGKLGVIVFGVNCLGVITSRLGVISVSDAVADYCIRVFNYNESFDVSYIKGLKQPEYIIKSDRAKTIYDYLASQESSLMLTIGPE